MRLAFEMEGVWKGAWEGFERERKWCSYIVIKDFTYFIKKMYDQMIFKQMFTVMTTIIKLRQRKWSPLQNRWHLSLHWTPWPQEATVYPCWFSFCKVSHILSHRVCNFWVWLVSLICNMCEIYSGCRMSRLYIYFYPWVMLLCMDSL